jgi:cytochrome P450
MGLSRDPIGYLQRQSAKLGDPFCLRFPKMGTVYFTGHPEGAEEIFTAGRDVFEPPPFNPVGPILGEHSLILLAGERHRRERKMMMPFFAGERMRDYAKAVADMSLEEVRGWQSGEELCAFRIAQSVFVQVIFQAIFGITERNKRERFKLSVRELLDHYSTSLAVFPFARRELGGFGPWARFRRCRDAFDALLREEMSARRATGCLTGQDILSQLMRAEYEDGTRLSDMEIIEEVRTLLVGGHDTSSNSLAWAFYRILASPRVLERLLAELDMLGAEPIPEQIAKLPYLDAVINEVLRLYPPVPFTLRRVRQPFTLRGLPLRPGDDVAVALVLLHRDPRIWRDPETFEPERFLGRKYKLSEFAPYGGGVRRCIGASFAGHAMKIILATVLRTAQLELLTESEPKAVSRGITMGPGESIALRYRGPRAATVAVKAASSPERAVSTPGRSPFESTLVDASRGLRAPLGSS